MEPLRHAWTSVTFKPFRMPSRDVDRSVFYYVPYGYMINRKKIRTASKSFFGVLRDNFILSRRVDHIVYLEIAGIWSRRRNNTAVDAVLINDVTFSFLGEAFQHCTRDIASSHMNVASRICCEIIQKILMHQRFEEAFNRNVGHMDRSALVVNLVGDAGMGFDFRAVLKVYAAIVFFTSIVYRFNVQRFPAGVCMFHKPNSTYMRTLLEFAIEHPNFLQCAHIKFFRNPPYYKIEVKYRKRVIPTFWLGTVTTEQLTERWFKRFLVNYRKRLLASI